MPARNHPRKLLVECETDSGVIAGLAEANGVPWPHPPNSPVFIDTRGGVDEILQPGVLEAELGASGLEALGVVVDANGDAASVGMISEPGAATSSRICRTRFPP